VGVGVKVGVTVGVGVWVGVLLGVDVNVGVLVGVDVNVGVGVNVGVVIGVMIGVCVDVGVEVDGSWAVNSQVSLKTPVLVCPPKRTATCRLLSYTKVCAYRLEGLVLG
jgi:hypothetical protein